MRHFYVFVCWGNGVLCMGEIMALSFFFVMGLLVMHDIQAGLICFVR